MNFKTIIIFISVLSSHLFASEFANKIHSSKSSQVYYNKIQPLFDQKCIACHSCYNSPCQLNMTSFDGVNRGANHLNIFDFSKIDAREPTRLGVDARTEKEWRKKGFYDVLDSKKVSLLEYFISLPHGPESKKQKVYDSEYSRSCVEDIDSNFDSFLEINPAGRMPLGFPGLKKEEISLLNNWVKSGAKGLSAFALERKILSKRKFKNKISSWESLFNRVDLKSQLASRYLYEHLFLASIYFKQYPKTFFRLVRSKTKTGDIVELPTDYPFDHPGEFFYYRLRPITQTIVHKSHIPFPFSNKRLEQYRDEFYDSKWKEVPKIMPAYGEQASNPFATFKSVPVKARYNFFLQNSAYHAMTFIKGPVCRGQTAVNVINDHFWVFFIDPSKDILVNDPKIYDSVTKKIKFPAVIKDKFKPLIDFRENYWSSVKEKFKGLKEQGPLDLSWLWKGESTNDNASLTIYRHFDSATILRGTKGRIPKTIWVLDYHVFESIYYNLSAGYNVFGPILHQVNSRLFMEISRIASEDLFLSFLAPNQRHRLRRKWNQIVPKEKESLVKDLVDTMTEDAREKLTKEYIYEGDKIKGNVLYTKESLLGKLQGEYLTAKQLHRENIPEKLQELTLLSGLKISPLPDAMLVKIDKKVYTIIHNKDHYNVAKLFFENDRRRPEMDSLDILEGVATSYVNFIFDLKKSQVNDFVDNFKKSIDKQDYMSLYKKYGMLRTNPRFWDVYSYLSLKSYRAESNEKGFLDLNRYLKDNI